MTITEVDFIPIRPREGLIGFASVVLDDEFYIGSLGVHVRPDGSYRITYPSKSINGRQLSLCHPIRQTLARSIESAVVRHCEAIFEKREEPHDGHDQTRHQFE